MAAGPLLYRPAPKWQVFAAFGGALLLHGIAVLAAFEKPPPPQDLSDIPTATIEATLDAPPEEQPTPPPEDIPLPPPPPDLQEVPEFHEESPPPKINRPTKPQAPIKAPQVAARPGMVSASQGKAAAISAPRPEYPYEARSHHITGSGVCVVTVDPASGNVTDATMAQSTGSPILDNSAVSAFRRWRFKPNTVSKVKIPITYTMTGASY